LELEQGVVVTGSFGHCFHHERDVSAEELGQKGCWNCHYFGGSKQSVYVDVYEAAEMLKKSRSTVVKWLEAGRLEGKLFVHNLPFYEPGEPRMWFVSKASIESMNRGKGENGP
jgi:hypothetical protein